MRLKSKSLLMLCLTVAAAALPAPHARAQAAAAGRSEAYDRFQIYGGYGYWRPFNSDINYHDYEPIYNLNAAASLTYFLGQSWGVEVEGNYFSDNRTKDGRLTANCGYTSDLVLHCEQDQTVNTLVAGPVYRRPIGRFIPYIHVMGGALRMNGPVANPQKTGWDVVGGVGVDYILPWWHDRLAVRPIQADGHFGEVDYGPLVLPQGITGGIAKPQVLHLSAGLVLRFGQGESTPEELTCSADPGTVYPGDVVHLSVVSRGMGGHIYYSWTAPNLKDGGGGASALDVPTGTLAPGNYEVSVRAQSGAHGRVRRTCSTGFQIHAWDPPTIACKAQPDAVEAGATVSIVADARSPENRPLTVSYATSAGAITGTGTTVSLATDGAPAGPVTVTCTATDDLGQKAQSTATVTINQPPAPVLPTVVQSATTTPALPAVVSQQALCTISFDRDRRRPTRVDNEAKACLDSVALSMTREAQNRLVIVGTYGPGETMNVAAARAIHAKQYLTEEKGIDASVIDVMLRQSSERSAENILLPPGATFEEQGAVGFDPTSVHPTGEAYGKHHAR